MLINNRAGNYDFLRGIGPFSAAVRAQPGFGIVRAAFRPLIPLERGYAALEKHLFARGRPMAALCGMQLRIPKPLSRDEFDRFNQPYIERLRAWGLEIDGANPVTRTNVAYEAAAAPEPMLAGFFYTTASSTARTDYVVSGVAEIASRNGGVRVVAAGDVSPVGLRQKTECILQVIEAHLKEIGCEWNNASTINLYSIHDPGDPIRSLIIPRIGEGVRAGITVQYARPPVIGLETEIDVWSVDREERVDAQL